MNVFFKLRFGSILLLIGIGIAFTFANGISTAGLLFISSGLAGYYFFDFLLYKKQGKVLNTFIVPVSLLLWLIFVLYVYSQLKIGMVHWVFLLFPIIAGLLSFFLKRI